jgi:hypothetical protein
VAELLAGDRRECDGWRRWRALSRYAILRRHDASGASAKQCQAYVTDRFCRQNRMFQNAEYDCDRYPPMLQTVKSVNLGAFSSQIRPNLPR